VGERWLADRIQSETSLHIDNKLILHDNIDIKSTKYSTAEEKLGGFHIFGIIIITGPKTTNIRNRINAVLSGRQSFEDKECSAKYPERKKSKTSSDFVSKPQADSIVSATNVDANTMIGKKYYIIFNKLF
jgi:urease accessory protein UreH